MQMLMLRTVQGGEELLTGLTELVVDSVKAFSLC